MKLTRENLIKVISENIFLPPNEKKITKESFLSSYIEPDDIYLLFQKLERIFNVSFAYFNFERFSQELESANKFRWFINSYKENTQELTFENLYKFMKENKKQELTLECFVNFLSKRFENINLPITPETDLRKDLNIDGIVAMELLMDLETCFATSFETFPFKRYFLAEEEILVPSLNWIQKIVFEKKEKKLERLTVGDLYKYMKDNNNQEIYYN